jgi:ubiquinone biosynthesis protein
MFQSFRNIFRVFWIAYILWRHNILLFWRDESPNLGKRIAHALEEMGPTFIKLGQALSTRSDLVGQEIAQDLAQLQDRLPPFPSGTVRVIITQQLGKPIDELFASFDNNAAAAASIAQVHFATLHDGRDVAIKVLRPNVEKAFAKDIALFYWLAGLAQYWKPNWRRFKLIEVVKMFEETIRMELDLRFEASAAVELKTNLRNDVGFYVPEIYWNYTAQRVLSLERIYGIPISDVVALKAAGHDPVHLVDIAAISFFNQVFRDGFFHADLHPGNLFVLANGDVAVVDFGIMGRLDKGSRLYLAQILHGFLTEDYYNLAKVHFDAGYVPASKSIDNFALALMALTKPIIGRKLSDISVARLLGQLFTTAEAFEMEVQPHLLLLQKNMMITEGVGRMLNPDVNMWQVAEPLIREWATKNLGPRAQIKYNAREAMELIRTVPALIRNANAALSKVSNGGIKLHPDTVMLMQSQRRHYQRQWLWFAWTVLIVGILFLRS